ncbi:DNA polymerase III subunit beta [Candidatus Saccharibacteria bacterium]|nr:DNA polymerase III subunit beta [Candidatus Saccharibacteria bacterium]
MKFKIKQNKLSRALNTVSRVAAGSRTTLPILNNVLIFAEKNKVSLSTTNLDMAITEYLPERPEEEGKITVPARLLAEFVGNLPRDEEITIENKGTKVTISAGKYQSVINGADAEDFPTLPEINEKKAVKFTINVDDFKNGINKVIVASSNDLTRPALTGVYFNTFNNGLYVAATDGYRLAEKKLIEKVKDEVAVIIPANSLQEIMRSIYDDVDEIEILFDETQAIFRLGEIEIMSTLIDGSFPDYRQLIPKDNEIVLNLKKDEVLRITKLAALFAKEVGGSIVCEAKKNKFLISSVANEYGENSSEIETEVENSGKVTLNSKFLIDALNAVEEEEIKISFSSRITPVVVENQKSKDYVHIIMPLKS